MPLRCVDLITGTNLHAFDLTPDAWQILDATNKQDRHLRMACCPSPVVLKRSALGTQFFAHKSSSACATAPETETHLRLKQMAVEAARAQGWEASAEVAGITPADEPWRADVLARKDGRLVAIEVQWSSQTAEETRRRQARYAEAGILCLWLFRQRQFPIGPDLPAVRIGGSVAEGFTASVPVGYREQVLPMVDFLTAAFSGRMHYGIPLGVSAQVIARAGNMFCWSCGAETPIITGIDVEVGPHQYKHSVPGLGDRPDLYTALRAALPNDPRFTVVKRRYSRTQARVYLSNGCAHCDALIGEFHEHEAWEDETVICQASIRVDRQLRQMLLHVDGEEERSANSWGVYTDNPC